MVISVPLGTALALGLRRWRGRGSGPANILVLLPLVTPELVFAVGMFLLFTSALGFIGLGTTAQAIGQVTFTLSWVVLIVRARLVTIGSDVEEAAADLGAPPLHVLFRVLLPLLVPAMVASLLVAFALSIDDFVVTQYLSSGSDTATVPMRIYAQARARADPGAERARHADAPGVAARARAGAGRVPHRVAPLGRRHVRGRGTRGGDAMSAGDIRLEGLVKRFGEQVAVDGIDLHVAGGEFFTLLGPSGCGKTTTLRLVAGFERPTNGRILLDDVDMSRTPPHQRRVNTVFQSYALFPHRCVEDNVAFGLRYRKVDKADARRRVAEALALVRLEGYERRRPSELSGGQQQRVALARALVLEPPVLLLDEPLGALDARLRVDLQVELKRIQEQLGITFIYVTHDQDEALTMSDRVAVMRGGRIEQLGEPREIYETPATSFVANFLGASNLLPVEVDAGELRLGSYRLACGSMPTGNGAGSVAMIRPENVRLREHGTSGENHLPGMVEEVVYLGFHNEVRVRLATGAIVKADVPNDGEQREHEQGDPVAVHLPERHLRVLEDLRDRASPPPPPAPPRAPARTSPRRRRSARGCRSRRSAPAAGRSTSSTSHGPNSPLATPSAIASANHSCRRAYSRAAGSASSGWRAGAQPQLDPQQPVVALVAGRRQARLDHHLELAGGARRAVGDHRGAGAAGQLVGELERLDQQRLARGEVVVHERRGDARVCRDAGDAHLVDALAGDPAHGRLEDPAARLRRRRSRGGGSHDSRRARTRIRRRRADPARGDGGAGGRAAPGRGRRADPQRGARAARQRRAPPRRARRPGLDRASSGSRSRSSSGAPPTRCPGTCRPRTTCSAHGTPEQIDRYLRPALRGELHDAYAVTEEHAGSDPSGITTTATPAADGGWRIDGEKWFVTYGDVAAVYIVMAHARSTAARCRRCSWSTRDAARDLGRRRPAVHAQLPARPSDDRASTASRSATDAVIGGVGGGDDLQRAWFVEERLGIAARGGGAMWRLLEETTAWAVAREQGGARLIDHQGVSFPLADSAADAAAGRLLGLEVARLDDAGADPKLVHAKASMAKLFVQRGGEPLRRPLRCRSSAGAATCAPTSPSASGANCASTASGRGRARSSG